MPAKKVVITDYTKKDTINICVIPSNMDNTKDLWIYQLTRLLNS